MVFSTVSLEGNEVRDGRGHVGEEKRQALRLSDSKEPLPGVVRMRLREELEIRARIPARFRSTTPSHNR